MPLLLRGALGVSYLQRKRRDCSQLMIISCLVVGEGLVGGFASVAIVDVRLYVSKPMVVRRECGKV